MKKTNLWLVLMLAVTTVAGLAAGVLAPTVASAAEAAPKLSQSVYKPLKAAQDALQAAQEAGKAGQDAAKAQKLDEALASIKEAQAVDPKTPYDSYMIDEVGWYVLLQKKDYAGAATMLEASVNSGFLPADQVPQRLKALAQINYQIQNYPKAVEFGNRFLETTPGDHDVSVLVAQALYLQKDYAGARAAVQKLTSGPGKPNEQLLLIGLRCNVELKDKPGAMQSLRSLVRYYPQQKYWADLLGNQLYDTKGDRELRTLYRLVDQTNTLDKAENYSEMGSVLIAGGFPAEAAKVLERGIAANVFTGDALTRAKQDLDRARAGAAEDAKDLPNAAKSLAAAKTGNDMVAVGKLYFSSGDYAKAADAIQKGLAKGVTDADDANALLGIALVRAGKPADARAPFSAVKDPKYAAVASLWVLYLDSTEPPAPAGS